MKDSSLDRQSSVHFFPLVNRLHGAMVSPSGFLSTVKADTAKIFGDNGDVPYFEGRMHSDVLSSQKHSSQKATTRVPTLISSPQVSEVHLKNETKCTLWPCLNPMQIHLTYKTPANPEVAFGVLFCGL